MDWRFVGLGRLKLGRYITKLQCKPQWQPKGARGYFFKLEVISYKAPVCVGKQLGELAESWLRVKAGLQESKRVVFCMKGGTQI